MTVLRWPNTLGSKQVYTRLLAHLPDDIRIEKTSVRRCVPRRDRDKERDAITVTTSIWASRSRKGWLRLHKTHGTERLRTVSLRQKDWEQQIQ